MTTSCLVLGLFLLSSGVLWQAAWIVRFLGWQTTTGVVVRLDDGVEMGDKHPRVRFISPEGREIEFVSRYCLQFESNWPIGRTVRVLFHPRRPERAVLYSVWDASTPLLIIAFGAMFLSMWYIGLR